MKIGELFAGYGGLGLGVQAAMGGEIAWVSEIDPGANKILEHRFPGVPNIGDITTVDWSTVEPVDILTGGSPCQDLSHAGRRKGMTEGTRSNLWVAMREAIAQLRPSLVVWENVRGAYSAAADSDLEFCPGCMGSPEQSGLALRALGRVLGDLSDLGFDAGGHGLRAADVGAPHGRFRVFVVAHAQHNGSHGAAFRRGAGTRQDQGWLREPQGLAASASPAHAADVRHQRTRPARDGRTGPENGDLLPTPIVSDWNTSVAPYRDTHDRTQLRDIPYLLPTPDTGESPNGHGRRGGSSANGHQSGANLDTIVQLLPTPNTMDGIAPRSDEALARARLSGGCANLKDVRETEWGVYAGAIARWEHLTRPAPPPTMLSKKGTPQLSPAFSEWMMGLPAGWVTDTPGTTRNEQLRALGNGVVPQQAAAAIGYLLDVMAARLEDAS